MMKKIIVCTITLSLLCVASISTAADNNRVVVVPLSTTTVNTPQTLVSASGEWSYAGLVLPSMILHDLVFYVSDLGTQLSCTFSMNFVTGQFTSRTIRQFDLGLNESVELHFEAGINTSDLRFGTIMGGGTACTRNWAAFGYQVP